MGPLRKLQTIEGGTEKIMLIAMNLQAQRWKKNRRKKRFKENEVNLPSYF